MAKEGSPRSVHFHFHDSPLQPHDGAGVDLGEHDLSLEDMEEKVNRLPWSRAAEPPNGIELRVAPRACEGQSKTQYLQSACTVPQAHVGRCPGVLPGLRRVVGRPQLYFGWMKRTPSTRRKSASWVQSVAPYSPRAVANMMLSAIGRCKSLESLAATAPS